jgi:hypothetical protein
MTRYVYLLVIWLVAACLAARADEIHAPGYGGSKYLPECFEHHCPPKRLNTALLLSGPSTLRGPDGRPETLMGAGYLRTIKDDLSVGAVLLGTDRRMLGLGLTIQYHW